MKKKKKQDELTIKDYKKMLRRQSFVNQLLLKLLPIILSKVMAYVFVMLAKQQPEDIGVDYVIKSRGNTTAIWKL